MQLSIAIVAFLVSFITALIVFQKNPRSGTNVYLSLLIFFISIYPVFNYLAVNSSSGAEALLWAKMILIVSIPQGPLLFFFAKSFPNSGFIFSKKLQIFISLWVLLNWSLAISGLIFASVVVNNGVVSITPGPFVPLFGLLHISTIIAGLVVLAMKYRRSIGVARRQLAYVYYGILISFVLTFLITFILPLILDNTFLLAISPIFLTLSVLSVAYAIVSQKLFDIRAAVARSATYVLLLLTIGLISFATLTILASLLDKYNIPFSSQRSLLIALTLILALSYQPFKRFFDSVTKKLFFQDAFDTQDLLNDFNAAIVSTIELEQLLSRASTTIEKYLKPEFCDFAIRDSEMDVIRLMSDGKINLSKESVEQIRAYIHKNEDRIVLTDLLEESQADLKLLLQEADIGMIVRITSDVSVEGIGYIVMGYKKSGNIYNTQDTSAIEILSNELAIAIQNALQFEEIQKFNITLQEKVDDATRQLRRTNEKLKQMDETKDEFISMASHQLRTPLTSVKGYISMVIEGDAGDLNKMQKKLLDQAFISSQRMVYLIADLLNVSRLRTGKFIIETAPANLSDIVQGEVDQLVETAGSRGLELKYDKPKDFPMLMLDETKIRQVIMNFIDNAIYYTPSGGHIKVGLKESGNTVEYTVTDDGIGVPKTEQPHMFSKFYRAGNAKKARPDGTGLGLFMAKKVIIAQGGSVIFKSESGKGSTFGFSFDKKKLEVPDHLIETDN